MSKTGAWALEEQEKEQEKYENVINLIKNLKECIELFDSLEKPADAEKSIERMKEGIKDLEKQVDDYERQKEIDDLFQDDYDESIILPGGN
tara:strand:+ start:2753 stop:3025 length:273 start_codon:yes stop_codon:yes gene_type:complete